MSGIGSVGGQGPIYPEYVGGPQNQWDGHASGDLKTDVATARNVAQALIDKIKNGTFDRKADLVVAEKLNNFLNEMKQAYPNQDTISAGMPISGALSSIDQAIMYIRYGGAGGLRPWVETNLEDTLRSINSIKT